MFDDPRRPDFDLDLWLPEDEHRRDARPPSAAIEEARSWLARAEAILRRAPKPAVHDEVPPWEDDDGDDAEPLDEALP